MFRLRHKKSKQRAEHSEKYLTAGIKLIDSGDYTKLSQPEKNFSNCCFSGDVQLC